MTVKPMILITTSWKEDRSFKMIPTIQDCAYNECIFDPKSRVLAVVSKEHKSNFHMLPVLDGYGMPKVDVPGNLKSLGKKYREERVVLDTYYEYYIEDKEEIYNFIETMAINSNNYDFKSIVEAAFAVEEETVD